MYQRSYRKKSQSSAVGAVVGLFLIVIVAFLGLSQSRSLNLDLIILLLILLIVVGSVFSVMLVLYLDQKEKRRAKSLLMSDIDRMTGVEFEHYIGAILGSRGFKVKYTPTSGDYGVDIIATDSEASYAVQLKRYSHALDQAPIREAVAGKSYYNLRRCMVITNNYFTSAAKKLAWSNYCHLVDRDKLSQWILEFQEEKVKDSGETSNELATQIHQKYEHHKEG